MMIWASPDPSVKASEDPSEFHLEIINLDISIDGDSGKLIQANQAHLFAMYIKNAANSNLTVHDFETWRKFYCTIALRPEDLGMRFGPGINHPISLAIRMRYRSNWVVPTGTIELGQNIGGNGRGDVIWGSRRPQLHVLSQYDRYELTLSMAGGSRRKLLALAPPTAAGVPAPQGDLSGVF